MKPNKQNGFASVVLAVIISMLFWAGILVMEFNSRSKQEISAAQYQELQDIAAQSCSGLNKLKSAAAKPITNHDAMKLRAELKSLADTQASANARASIVNAKPECPREVG